MDMAWHCTKHCSDRARGQLGRGGHILPYRRKDLILHIACVDRHSCAVHLAESPVGLGKSENPTQKFQVPVMRVSFVLEYCLSHCAIIFFCPCVVDTMHSRTLQVTTGLPNFPQQDCNSIGSVGSLQPINVGLAEVVNVPCPQISVDASGQGIVLSTAPTQYRCECHRPVTSSPSYPSSQASRSSDHQSRGRRPQVWCRSEGCMK